MNDKSAAETLTRLKQWFQQAMPTPESLAGNRWLKPIAHRLMTLELWSNQPEPLARGVALGVFWAFVIPVGQIPLAVLHCLVWRGNIPAAAIATFINNPLTLGFWLWLAYRFGSLFVPAPLPPEADVEVPATGVIEWLLTVGWPVVIGMGSFAIGGALLGYALVKIGWALRRWLEPDRP